MVDTLSELALVGLSHRTAPVAVREQYAVKAEDLAVCLRSLVDGDDVQEAVVLSTCNRTEVLVLTNTEDGAQAIRKRLFRNIADEHLYTYRGIHAVMHVLRVACGLDSLVLGEGEILTQTRQAFEAARTAGTAGKLLDALGKQAIETGKRVRTETELGQGTLSIARVAVDIVHHAFGALHHNNALIVGAGETGLLVAKHLRDEGIRRIDFANRTPERAQEAAREFGGTAYEVDQVGDLAPELDVIIVCVDGAPALLSHAALDPKRLKRRDQPLLVIDLSMPRAVDPEVAGLQGLLLYNLDDLEPVVERNRIARGEASRASADILVSEVHKFLSLRTYAAFSPAITDLRLRFGSLREKVLDEVTEGRATPRELELAHELGKQLLDLALEQMKEGVRNSRSAEALGREYERFMEGL